MFQKQLKKLSKQQIDFGLRIFDLIITRVLKRAYLNLDENARKDIEKAFVSGSDEEKEGAVKKYIPNFEKLFEEEAKKIEEELKLEIAKQI